MTDNNIDIEQMDTDELLRMLIEQQSFLQEVVVHELHRQYELQLAVALLTFKDDDNARQKLVKLADNNDNLEYETPVAWQAMMQRMQGNE